ncbi:MAG TPA: hypothetical protein EYP62_03545 [Kiritimatiellae bacterium]|nr:hypothetical protein [Kiritimatiellia bacterium]
MHNRVRIQAAGLTLIVLAIAFGSGCASAHPRHTRSPAEPVLPVLPPYGCLFSHISGPLSTDFQESPVAARSGSATVRYLDPCLVCNVSLPVAFGSAQIREAASDGGIKSIHYADYEYVNVLRIYQELTIRVYGD